MTLDANYIIGSSPDFTTFRNFVSLDTRSREIRNRQKVEGGRSKEIINTIIRKYDSSVGEEYFISIEDELGYIYGFTRLLLPRARETLQVPGLGKHTAIIRELHVYGQMESLTKTNKKAEVQHSGFGRRLMALAEGIASHHDYAKLSVIS